MFGPLQRYACWSAGVDIITFADKSCTRQRVLIRPKQNHNPVSRFFYGTQTYYNDIFVTPKRKIVLKID